MAVSAVNREVHSQGQVEDSARACGFSATTEGLTAPLSLAVAVADASGRSSDSAMDPFPGGLCSG